MTTLRLAPLHWLPLCCLAGALVHRAAAQDDAPAAASPATVVAGPLQFEERLIRKDYGYAYGLAAADLDADGDLDLTSSDTTNDLLLWFENDGRGALTERRIFEHDPGWFERHHVRDMNGDGFLDVVIVKNRVGDLLWFENSGHPRDGALWSRHVITQATLPGIYDVTAADFDADGDPDCAVSSYARGNLFAWYENPGLAAGDQLWAMHDIAGNLAETRTIEAADFNRDGRPDLLGSAMMANTILWFENTGESGAERWRKRIIDDRSGHPCHGHAVDFDADGDLDVVMAHGYFAQPDVQNTHHVAWYENVGAPGAGAAWHKHLIGPLETAFEAVAGDLDGDGDLDVAATAYAGATPGVTWFENPGPTAAAAWPAHPLRHGWPTANSVIVMDLDADGRLDVAASAERGANEFRLWRNLGPRGAP